MRLVAHRFMLALLMGLLGAGNSATADDDLYAHAAEHYRAGHWQQACDAFGALLADQPDGPRAGEARFFYGEALVQLGRWADARGQFDELLKSDPAGPHARGTLFRAGEAAYMLGDRPAAARDLHAFHRRYPEDPLDAYVLPYLGSLELQSGNAGAAHQLFSQAVTQFADGPLAAEARFGEAQALHQSGKLEQARDRYRAIIEADSPLAEPALLQLGTAENALGDYQGALEAFDQFAARFPASALADKGSLGRGYALYKLARFRAAAVALEPLAGKRPLGVDAAYWLALAQKGQDEWQAAVKTLRSIDDARQHRLAPAIAFHTADALRRDGQLPQAQQEFERARTRFPDSPWADDSLLGELHIAVERHEHAESVRLADALTANFPDSPLAAQAALAKGQAWAALDKPDDAIAVLDPLSKATTSSNEIRSRAQATLAVCHAGLGHYEQARRMLEAMSDAESPAGLTSETTYHVAELALASGDAALAQELFSSVAGGDGSAELANRAQSGLAWSHFQAGRWAEAAQAFAALLESNPRGPLAAEAALLRGRALENLEQFEPALAMYRQVVEEHATSPRVAEALAGSGRLLEKLGRPDEARASYATLVENHADFAERDVAVYRYAWLLRPTDAAAADRLFERLGSEFPQSPFVPDATLRLAESAFDRQEFADVERLLADVVEPDVPDAVRQQALYLSGRLEAARGRWPEAIGPLARLVAEFPDGELASSSSYLIAEAEFRQGKYEQAAAHLAELAANTPNGTENWLATAEMRRAQALAHLRRWNEAIEVARGISTRFANFDQQYEVDYTIGRALAAQADFSEARKWYAKAIASRGGGQSETAAMAQWMIGESYLHQQDYDAALGEYQKVTDRYPRWHAAALLQAGKCAEALERWPAAVELYQRLLKKYPAGKLSAEATRRMDAAGRRATGRSAALN